MPTIELDSDLKIGNQPVKSAYKGTNLINLNVRNTLFANGEQGAWYDPSDMSTMFQDSAGTTPVTAVEQPVGLILDKSKAGVGTNGAFRYNLLTNTEDFGAASWVKSRATISTNAAIAPNGTLTADSLNQSTNSTLVGEVTCSFVWESGVVYTFSVYAKPSGKNFIRIIENGSVSSGDSATFFNVSTGVVGAKSNLHTASITPAGDGWYRCSISFVSISSSTKAFALGIQCADNDNSTTIVSSGGLYIWGASLTTVANASLPYQRIGADWSSTLPGNHATQTTTTSRPVLSARVNLLTKTEQFADAVWGKTGLQPFGSGSVANTTVTTDPNGGNTADFICENTLNSPHAVSYNLGSGIANTVYTASVYARKFGAANGRRWMYFTLLIGNSGAPANRYVINVDLSNGSVTDTKIGTSINNASAPSVQAVGDYWKISISASAPAASVFYIVIGASNSATPTYTADGDVTYTGDGTSGIYIWGADLRATNMGVGLPAYQRVNTSTDYDTAGFPMYLRFDGVDDFLVTPSINFTSTDKMTVFAGVRKLSDGSFPIIAELSTSSVSINGTFGLLANANAADTGRYAVGVRASAQYEKQTLSVFKSPISSVITITSDFAGAPNEQSAMRINGVSQSLSLIIGTNAGTGNYGNHPLYIGRRGAGGLQFNGHIYSLIVRGAQSTAQQVTQTEQWVNSKTRAY